jgi:hypothetical protein
MFRISAGHYLLTVGEVSSILWFQPDRVFGQYGISRTAKYPLKEASPQPHRVWPRVGNRLAVQSSPQPDTDTSPGLSPLCRFHRRGSSCLLPSNTDDNVYSIPARTLNPAPHATAIHSESALRQQFGYMLVGQRIPQIPAHGCYDHFSLTPLNGFASVIGTASYPTKSALLSFAMKTDSAASKFWNPPSPAVASTPDRFDAHLRDFAVHQVPPYPWLGSVGWTFKSLFEGITLGPGRKRQPQNQESLFITALDGARPLPPAS